MFKGIILVSAIILALTAWLTGCTTSVPPVSPAPPNQNILWDSANLTALIGVPGESASFCMGLSVNGAADPTATVTITGPGGSYAAIQGYTSKTNEDYFQVEFSPCAPGQVFTLTTVTAAGTASASLTMPGPVTLSADGFTVSWGNGGNTGGIEVFEPKTNQITYQSYPSVTSLSSPTTIPASAYPTTGTTYSVNIAILNSTTNILGTASGSFFGVAYPGGGQISK